MKNKQTSIWNHKGKLLTLTLAGSMIYFLPFYRFYFYDTFIKAFDLSNTQMGLIGTVYGAVGIVSYFFGGILASKYSNRLLMTISFMATGLGGLVLLTYPSFIVVLLVQILWGVTTLMTFWPALVKTLNILSNENEKGKTFGIMEGGRGVSNIIFMTIAVGLFDYFARNSSETLGLSSVMIFYSIIAFIMGIVIFFTFKSIDEQDQHIDVKESNIDVEAVKTNQTDELRLRDILKNKYLWLMVVIIFCTYSMCIAYTYFTPYASARFNSSTTFAAFIAVFAQYTRPIACIGSGVIADRISSSRVFIVSIIMMIVGIGGVFFVGGNNSLMYLFVISVVLCYIAMYASQALHFTLFEEAKITPQQSAMAVGIVCAIGYAPEMLVPLVAGRLLDSYSGIQGYLIFFAILMTVLIIGFITILIWMKLTRERRMEMIKHSKQLRHKRI